jgi:hypothetical protein
MQSYAVTRSRVGGAALPRYEDEPGHGVGVRRLDHAHFLAADVVADADFQQHVLGARPTEQTPWTATGSPPPEMIA